MEREKIVKVALDVIDGRMGEFSAADHNEAIRNAFVELNGGTKLTLKTFRNSQAFALLEELIPNIIETGLREDNPLFALLEYRNIAEGDVNEFQVDGTNELVVSNVAKGIQGIRRQRIMGKKTLRIETEARAIKVYEELSRLLAGRITFTDLVDNLSKAFTKQILNDAYAAVEALSATTPGMNGNFVETGTYSEEALVELIDRIEAITGKTAKIVGTRAALRKITTATEGEVAKSSMYDLGYYGKFNGTDMIVMKQSVKKDGAFILDNSRIFVLASDDKPIKVVNEGEGYIGERASTDNDDLTQEYVYIQAYGVGAIAAAPIGIMNVG